MTVVAAVAIAWTGSALATGVSTGTLEICKASLNGMSGRSFTFSVNGGAPITVKGGRCTGPMSVAAGNVTILEQQSDPATDVAAIRTTPSARVVSQDLDARKVVVSVPVGTTASNETRVTYVNQPAGGNYGDLKICKLTETPAFLGRDFSFKVNGGSAISVTAADAFDDPANWSCRLAGHFQVGSVVSVQELTPPEAEVAWIDTDPAANLVDFDTNAATATVQIAAGVTVVEFDNEAHTPQGNGYLEICKDRAQLGYDKVDWAVQGTFTFTVEDASGASQDVDVLAGQCSAPLQVAAGIAHVTEHAVDGIDLVDAYTIPEERLMGVNLINKTADVEVPVSSDPNDETQLHMVNQAQRAQLKICKALGPGSSDLIGQTFYFDVDSGNGPYLDSFSRYPFSITAAGQTQCKIWGDLPIGTDVSVNELFANDGMTPALGALPIEKLPSNDFIDTTGGGTITMKPGINTVTVTNTAKGQLEICKKQIDKLKLQPYFNYLVDGSTKVKVQAGKCSLPLRVSVGNHTVVEVSYDSWLGNPGQNMSSSSSIFELDSGLTEEGTVDPGIYVYPPDRQVALNSNTRTVTVSVPYGPNGGETVVTYKNRIKKARLKVCKVIPSTSYDSLHGKLWTYTIAFKNDGTYTTDPIADGECTYLTRDFPIVQSDGTRTEITVTENPAPPLVLNTNYIVSAINVQFAYDYLTNTNTGVVVLHPGPGVNVVTYTNQSIDP